MSMFFQSLAAQSTKAVMAVFTRVQNTDNATISDEGRTVTWSDQTYVSGEISTQNLTDGNEYGFDFTCNAGDWVEGRTLYVGFGNGYEFGVDLSVAAVVALSGPDSFGVHSFQVGSPFSGFSDPAYEDTYSGEVLTVSVQTEAVGEVTVRLYGGANPLPLASMTMTQGPVDRLGVFLSGRTSTVTLREGAMLIPGIERVAV